MLKRKAIIESLPKHRFEEVLKDAGFRASKYLHESDSGLSGNLTSWYVNHWETNWKNLHTCCIKFNLR